MLLFFIDKLPYSISCLIGVDLQKRIEILINLFDLFAIKNMILNEK